jgi:hypothetical protein
VFTRRRMNTIKRAPLAQNLTAAPIEPGASGSSKQLDALYGPVLPEYGRFPDVERIFGVKRGLAYRAINNGDIKSVVIRENGKKTGARLIHLQSVRDWLNKQLG